MVRVRYLLVLVVLTVGIASQAWANMAPLPQRWQPDSTQPAETVPLVVVVDHHQAQTRLIIPKRLLGQPSEFQQLPGITPRQLGGDDLRSRTAVAGVTLSLLLVGGGVVTILIRRRRGRAAAVASVALITLLGVYVSMAVADLPPQPTNSNPFELAGPYSGKVPSMIPLPRNFSGNLVIQPVDQGDRVTLIIGRDLAGKFSNINAPPALPASNAAPAAPASR